MAARDPLEEGLLSFDKGQWDAAVRHFERANALGMTPTSIYWLAQARFQQAQELVLPDAWAYVACWRLVAEGLRVARSLAATRVEVDMTLLEAETRVATAMLFEHLERLGAEAGESRDHTLARLAELAHEARLPNPLPAGRMRGRLLTLTLHPAVDDFGRFMAGVWLPWRGKVLDPGRGSGDNIFERSALPLVRGLYPAYRGVTADTDETFRACTFRLWVGPSLADGRPVLKLDYDLPENPGFPLRRVLDELAEVGPGVYIGRAFLRGRSGWRLAAYFALTPEGDA